jgi:hypothetical protein
MSDRKLWLEYVMNAIMDHIWADALFVEDKGFQMLIIVKNVCSRKRIEMDVVRLSIWEVLELTFSMNAKNMALKNDITIYMYSKCIV